MRKVSLFYIVIKNKGIMKVVHQAPHQEKLIFLDLHDNLLKASYDNKRKSIIRSLKKVKIEKED